MLQAPPMGMPTHTPVVARLTSPLGRLESGHRSVRGAARVVGCKTSICVRACRVESKSKSKSKSDQEVKRTCQHGTPKGTPKITHFGRHVESRRPDAPLRVGTHVFCYRSEAVSFVPWDGGSICLQSKSLVLGLHANWGSKLAGCHLRLKAARAFILRHKRPNMHALMTNKSTERALRH